MAFVQKKPTPKAAPAAPPVPPRQAPQEEGGIPDAPAPVAAEPAKHPLLDSKEYKGASVEGRILFCLEYLIRNGGACQPPVITELRLSPPNLDTIK